DGQEHAGRGHGPGDIGPEYASGGRSLGVALAGQRANEIGSAETEQRKVAEHADNEEELEQTRRPRTRRPQALFGGSFPMSRQPVEEPDEQANAGNAADDL